MVKPLLRLLLLRHLGVPASLENPVGGVHRTDHCADPDAREGDLGPYSHDGHAPHSHRKGEAWQDSTHACDAKQRDQSSRLASIEEVPMATFQVYVDKAGEYRWRLRASGNNEIIADSGEGYKAKRDCLHGLELVKEQAPGADVDEQA